MDGYKIVQEVLEMSSQSAIYARKMMAKAKQAGNMNMYNKWKMIISKSGRALKVVR